MKQLFFLTNVLFLLLSFHVTNAQVSTTLGVEINNKPSSRLSSIVGSDNDFFYVYRIDDSGTEAQHYMEKYDKKDMALVFSKEIVIKNEDRKVKRKIKIVNVTFSCGSFFVFKFHSDKSEKKYSFSYLTVSTAGDISSDVMITEVGMADPDFNLVVDKSKKRMAVVITSIDDKAKGYQTKAIVIDGLTKRYMWEKQLANSLVLWTTYNSMVGYSLTEVPYDPLGISTGLQKLYLDDYGNLYSAATKKTKAFTLAKPAFQTVLRFVNGKTQTEKEYALDTCYSSFVFDAAVDGEASIAFFYVDRVNEKAKKDVYHQVIFNCIKVNTKTGTLISKVSKELSPELLVNCESHSNRGANFYVHDVVFIGGATYYYAEATRVDETTYISPSSGGYISNINTVYTTENVALLVIKISAQNELQWISFIPSKNTNALLGAKFKTFVTITGSKNLYLLYNEHPANLSFVAAPGADLKSFKRIRQREDPSNFVYSSVSLATGKVEKHDLVGAPKPYSLNPLQFMKPEFLPTSITQLSVPTGPNEVIIHTDDRGKSRFIKVKVE